MCTDGGCYENWNTYVSGGGAGDDDYDDDNNNNNNNNEDFMLVLLNCTLPHNQNDTWTLPLPII